MGANNNYNHSNHAKRPRNGQGNRQEQISYVGAPYNFVSFSGSVYEYPKDKLTAHNQMSEELVTGEISYEIEAKTPIMIDNGKGRFYKDARGRYAIPGSTVRGLIRNNVQILGLSGFDGDIDDYALMYRNVAYGEEKQRYNAVLGAKQLRITDGDRSYGIGVLLNVRAGYVSNENGKYIIYQNSVESIKKEFQGMNYYALSERKIIGDYLKDPKGFRYQVFRPDGKSILQHEFKPFGKFEKGGRVQYKGVENKAYRPYHIPVSYKVAHEKDVIAVGRPGEYEKEGYAVSTGKMNQKKVVYIIPEIDKTKPPIEIPEKDVRAFRIDMKKKENTLKQFGGRVHFDLPEEGERPKPIFYIELNGRFYFGFTPRLRLFYDHTVKEGLKKAHKTGKVDYSKALFGYTDPGGSYKSKLSFSDAVVLGAGSEAERTSLILAEPKPSSYLDYLKPDGSRGVTYNADNFELRGVKQYWLHKELVRTDGSMKNKEKVSSVFTPLKSGVRFAGKIRFQNLTKDELGLLLWSVGLEPDSWMNVGKAKAFGYGAVSLKITGAKSLELDRAYSTEGELELDPFRPIDMDEAVKAYKKEINRFLGSRKIDELPQIKEFFAMKDSKNIPDNEKTRYMSIENKEYQSRKKVLPSVGDVVKG